MTACNVGNSLRLVARTIVRDDHFAHDPGGRAGNQRGQRWNQRPFRITRCQNDAEHAAAVPDGTQTRTVATQSPVGRRGPDTRILYDIFGLDHISIVLVLFTSRQYMQAMAQPSASTLR